MLFKKAGLALGTAVVTLSLFATQIFAQEYQPSEVEIINPYGIESRWVNASRVVASISSSQQMLSPSAAVQAKSTSATISGTLYLEKKSNGSWANVTSWSISSTGSVSISKTYSGTSGVEYHARVVVTVTDNGTPEKIEDTSSSCTA